MTCGTSGADACMIGAVGPGGGLIFFVDYNDEYSDFDYLEVEPGGFRQEAPMAGASKRTVIREPS
jgi:hypothetical protein